MSAAWANIFVDDKEKPFGPLGRYWSDRIDDEAIPAATCVTKSLRFLKTSFAGGGVDVVFDPVVTATFGVVVATCLVAFFNEGFFLENDDGLSKLKL